MLGTCISCNPYTAYFIEEHYTMLRQIHVQGPRSPSTIFTLCRQTLLSNDWEAGEILRPYSSCLVKYLHVLEHSVGYYHSGRGAPLEAWELLGFLGALGHGQGTR